MFDLYALLSKHSFDPAEGTVLAQPGFDEPGYWVGAPSLVVHSGKVCLSYLRTRPRELRNGGSFQAEFAETTRHAGLYVGPPVTTREVGGGSFGRWCIRAFPETRLVYASLEDAATGRSSVFAMEAATPLRPRLGIKRRVLAPERLGVHSIADPYVYRHRGTWYLFVNVQLELGGPAPTYVAQSTDGIHFESFEEALPVGTGWDGHRSRLTSILHIGELFFCSYDGCASDQEDGEERCGAAVARDVGGPWERILDFPWLASREGTGSLRYVEFLDTGDHLLVVYECARVGGSHNLRLSRLNRTLASLRQPVGASA